MDYSIAQIRHILQLPPLNGQDRRRISQLLTDSRNLSNPAQTLFVALVTARQDGHHFITELYEKGVRAFLVSRLPEAVADYREAAFVQVPDTLTALQTLAKAWRQQFSLPVIGITGSNGKTIVKEWLFQLLAADFHIVRSPKSYNSQTGVPLSVAGMNGSEDLAIFEAGISLPGEMARLEKMIQPDIGLFTNIGEAHAEGFTDLRHKVREKLVLFQHADWLIYRRDHPVVAEEVDRLQRARSQENPLQLFSWTVQKGTAVSSAHLVVTKIKALPGNDGTEGTRVEADYQGAQLSIEIPFSDAGSIENAIHCWCLLLHLQIAPERIAERMKQLQPVAMRLQMKPGMQDCTLINDSYNSDLASIKVALDFLIHQGQHQRRTLILSDVEQSGENEPQLYKKIAALVADRKIDRFIGIGPALSRQRDLFKQPATVAFFPTTEACMAAMQQKDPQTGLEFHQETILLKGARQFGFERLTKLLEQKKHQAVLQINLNAIVYNLKAYQALLRPAVRTMVMVKAFSYGSGSAEVAGLLQYYRVDYLAVASIDEGIDLRKKGIVIPILVLNPDPFYFDALLEWRLEPEIYSFSLLQSFYEKVRQEGLTEYAIHLKLDTGMHRLGFMPAQVPELIRFLKRQPLLKVASVFSHLAAAEDPRMDAFTRQQGRLFDEMSRQITRILPYPVLRHLANTSGISRHPDLQFDMVRLGIGLYGMDPAMGKKLQTVHRLQAVISQIKNIPAGETIGYGRRGKAGAGKRIAVIALGYADGYLRALGQGKGRMYLHGKYAPTIGNICMDMLMIDITGIAAAREGEMVVVFGEKPTIAKVAEWGGTIPYEILTGLSQRIVRVYVHE